MLTRYPILDTLDVKRQGQDWLSCDVASCTKEAQVKDDELPKGWVTDDPNDDPLKGAAQFCPDHASRVSEALVEQ